MEPFMWIISVIFSLFLAVIIWKKFDTFVSDIDRVTETKFGLFIKKIAAFILILLGGSVLTHELLAYLFAPENMFLYGS